MKIYNTMTRKKEEFKSIEPEKVKIYACGPTVYNYIHIGNARPICVFDVLRRYFEYRGYSVDFVQNFTDVDDKIINKANEENKTYIEISEKFIEEYKKDADKLNIKEATFHPRATQNIENIINLIETLIKKDYAYQSENGDVYFRSNKFNDYGKLSHQPLEDLEAGARINNFEMKENPMDFALWKASKPNEPSWNSPWGKGRPGWHIECSAMAKRYLGKTIDIHCGGQDLIFPHHENEIAQSECANDAEFARYWMHNGYININNKKMSKSLGNFFTVREIGEKYGYEPIRYIMIASHYRTPISFSTDLLEQARSALNRLYNCKENLEFALSNANDGENNNDLKLNLYKYKDNFINAMDDDLNTADAIACLFDLVREINSNILNKDESVSKTILQEALDLFNELSGVLGLVYSNNKSKDNAEIERLINERSIARKNKDWVLADKLRDKLNSLNVVIEDTPQGVKWSINELHKSGKN